MSVFHCIFGIVAIALLMYLFVVLFKPEWF